MMSLREQIAQMLRRLEGADLSPEEWAEEIVLEVDRWWSCAAFGREPVSCTYAEAAQKLHRALAKETEND